MLLFVDNLTNVDFSFLHAERGLLGETWLASIEMEGALDEQGMVCDFGVVKKTLRHWLDTVIDHCLLAPVNTKSYVGETDQTHHTVKWQYSKGEIHCRSPHQAITLIDADEITPETVARWCEAQVMALFPSSVKQLKIRFTPENLDSPQYHYSHGLKKHAGNCQRIAHGHRSKIDIWRDGQLSEQDIAAWAEQWRDIYIGTREDLTSSDSANIFSFAYTAEQGDFTLQIPASHCYLIETDSTVEFIAQHIASELSRQHPGHHFKVKAYEGIGKGAIAEAGA